ncbi:MAG TPA: C13 family peptidase [Rhizomicrobium sp.]|jgi:hypothetical protein
MRLVTVVFALALAVFARPVAAADFSDWGAIVVAGDHHAHDGGDSEVFDDGRHDIGVALQRLGFKRDNIEEFSTQPQKYTSPAPLPSDPGTIASSLWDLSTRTSAGCLIYVTSHGSPDGVVIGNDMFAPKDFARMVNNACGQRPTVVVVSACFSGVFVPYLQGASRFVLTAARPDRTSFGCGQSDHYTFFDQCFLSSIAVAHDFPDLADETRRCVATREVKEKMSPPSDPQVAIGSGVTNFPRW